MKWKLLQFLGSTSLHGLGIWGFRDVGRVLGFGVECLRDLGFWLQEASEVQDNHKPCRCANMNRLTPEIMGLFVIVCSFGGIGP